MNIIDARKLNCPQPLVLAKNALDGGLDEITVIIDNENAKTNITKYCSKMGYLIEIKDEKEEIHMNIRKNNTKEVAAIELTEDKKKQNEGYLIGTNMLGNGSEELGKILMKGFIYAITQVKPYPEFIIFLNSGVKLSSGNSDSIDDLTELLQGGTKIVSCGTCLDYYQLKDKLKVGEITNMYDIVEIISSAEKVITIN